MSEEQKPASSDGASRKARALSARLSAVQALYQVSQNRQPMRVVLDEYLHHRSGMEVQGERLVQPDEVLLKAILYGVEECRAELESVVDANLKKDAQDRVVEPLLRSILICGAYELLIQNIDKPIIINDYLNVAHSFYERNEVALINGVLDSVASVFR
ncbi:MAG TPA: transcription antitermination factor NusB [Alphaproteobacteria bacterium]|nr:transcription antitermination protein NusB [Alphaproteobacteria bacterium]USO06061.1 MAG: transcription antitermination protein NusB [Rhodospirillales bacterium]HOO81372.1 transcription antitermination factor NusB [Alphaproteobacteria bacterium]